MGEKDFNAYQDQDYASEEFRLQTTGNGLAEARAEMMAEKAEKEGDHTDDQQGNGELGETMIARTGEGDADGQRIDACGNGQHNLSAQIAGIEVLFFRWSESLTDHVPANEQQQSEGYPVVIGLNLILEIADAQPAQQGHQSLEESEEKGHADIPP